MSAFAQFTERTAAALRKTATNDKESQRAIPTLAALKITPAVPVDPARPFRILVRTANGFESRPVTAAEALAHLNRGCRWHRIG